MSKIDLGQEDGFVTIVATDGTEVKRDLFEVNAAVRDYHQKNQGRPDAEYNAGLIELFQGFGLPGCSVRVAARLVRHIHQMVEEVKKKDSLTPASPASTASTPSS